MPPCISLPYFYCSYSREMNQIMLKYAIYENDSFAKLENLIVDEDISKRPPTWYAKFNDKTMLMIPNRDSFCKKFQTNI